MLGSRGHDGAFLRPPKGLTTLCTDQVIEGVHVDPDTPARLVGRKAAARALSDLAACAARPTALLLALRAPDSADEARLRSYILGVEKEGQRWGAALVGGDLACAPGPASLAVSALGDFSGRGRPPGRACLRPGQELLCTGPVGGSRLGRHLKIEPRLELGIWLYGRGVRAMMDVSDGLAWDVFRMARRAGVHAMIDRVPIHRDAHVASLESGRSALDHALHDGEDHELIVGVSQSKLGPLLAAAKRAGHPLSPIGSVRKGQGLRLKVGAYDGPWDPSQGGWQHGA